MGLTFKEDCPDIRNTRVLDVIDELKSYGIDIHVHDPACDPDETREEYGLELSSWDALPRADAIVAAVAHKDFVARPVTEYIEKLSENGCFVDVKGKFDLAGLKQAGLTVWRL
ncbi:MAG TPA: UDP binding domain-containing protein [Hyphomicrobiaceae bacterium]|nr:UDP binding domain-containing protein [Hyphomicrobiaceae bacterium]